MDCVDGLSGIEWLRHFFSVSVGFDGLCRWVERKKGVRRFFPSVWDLMDCVLGLSGKSGVRRFFFPSRWDLMDCALCTQSQMLDQGRT